MSQPTARVSPPAVPDKPEIKPRNPVWGFLRPIVIFLIAALLVWFLVSYVVKDVRDKYFEPVDAADGSAVEVVIPKGASLSQISEILYDNDLIRNKQVFKFYTDFTDNAAKLKAGTYQLARNMSFDDIIYTLRQSVDAAPTALVTLPEGLTITAFGNLLETSGVTSDSEYESLSQTGEGIALPVGLQDENVDREGRLYLLEGYLFPDTYEFYRDAPAADVIKRQLARFDEVVTEEHALRAAELGMSLDDVVTLASLIEKEAKVSQFAQVSAVFQNRLAAGMPLQSDASVSYGLGITNRINLTAEELEAATNYNTYANPGLPVGPICNPGLAAIEAVLYPDQQMLDDGYLYFTLTDPETGVLEFSKTYEEHQAVADQWRPTWIQWDAAHAS